MNPDLEPSRTVALELQINEELGALSGVVGSKSIRRVDFLRTLRGVSVLAVALLFWMSFSFQRGALATWQILFLVCGIIIPSVLFALIAGRKYSFSDGHPVSLFVTEHSVQLGEQVVRWIDVRGIHSDTAGIVHATLRVECKGQPPLLLLASREAVHWLHRLFEYYHREAHGEDGAVPQTLEAMRKRPQET